MWLGNLLESSIRFWIGRASTQDAQGRGGVSQCKACVQVHGAAYGAAYCRACMHCKCMEWSKSYKLSALFSVQSKLVPVAKSFKYPSPWLNFRASLNADKICAWLDGNWELSWGAFMMITHDYNSWLQLMIQSGFYSVMKHSALCSVICLETNWNTFWCGFPLFHSQIKEPTNLLFMKYVIFL